MSPVKFTWFGRCCFLIEIEGFRILLDPYDHYHNVDIGEINSDYTIISSIAHDHGNIAASPHAFINGYRGRYKVNEKIIFNGMESKEARGSLNLICNVVYGDLSITNFADWGDPASFANMTEYEKKLLSKTNIALVRSRELTETIPGKYAYDLMHLACAPQIIIPVHFFPESFVHSKIPVDKRKNYQGYLDELDRMIKDLSEYKKKTINTYECTLTEKDLSEKSLLLFDDIHPQVKYI
jgi:hypothetical protein